ncbi:MAG: Rab family GTPase [Promethearchaeia archaeon]
MKSENRTISERYWVFKVVITGEPGVGKTSLAERFVSGHFLNDYRASIGVNMYVKKLELGNMDIPVEKDKDHHVDIQLWDIAGHERWKKTRHLYYGGAQGALIIGDLTREKTFEEIETFWFPDLMEHCNDEIPLILVGNKADLPRKVNQEKLDSLGEEINALETIITSAKTGNNVETAFRLMSKKVIERSEKI